MMVGADYYRLLQVDSRADPEVIRAAYRVLIRRYHPDTGDNISTDEGMTDLLCKAYQTLHDPKQRDEYDRSIANRVGEVIDGYRLVEKIVVGGFGITYKAEHVRTGLPVCVKHCSRVSPQDEDILVAEAQAMWDLRHFAIPAVRNLVQLADGSWALIMSYVPGPTLEEVVTKSGALNAEHVGWIAERVVNALKYMHYHGVVHGDIKPQNIIIQPRHHQVVLLDFGLSAIKPKAGSDSKGYTPYFAPPEEEAGRVLVPESDFFSLGATMIYALSGGDLHRVERRDVPVSTPNPMCQFIQALTAREVLSRPNWAKSDVFDDVCQMRLMSFGRARSDMKPIPGF